MPPPEPPQSGQEGPAWTLADAASVFDRAGLPVSEPHLAAIVKAVRDASGGRVLRPVGRAPSGERGGVGKATYSARELQELHRDLARWIAAIPDPAAAPEAGQ